MKRAPLKTTSTRSARDDARFYYLSELCYSRARARNGINVTKERLEWVRGLVKCRELPFRK